MHRLHNLTLCAIAQEGVRKRTLDTVLSFNILPGDVYFVVRGNTNGEANMSERYLDLIRDIKSGKTEGLKQLYFEHEHEFVAWAKAQFQCSETQAEDIFQEVMVIFYENIIQGKIESLRSHIRTYLFGIGRLLILQQFRKGSRLASIDGDNDFVREFSEAAVADYRLELSDTQKIMKEALERLGKRCRDLLHLFYYRRYSNESIVKSLGYKNENVVKSQKVRCMKALREMIQQNFSEDLT